MTRTALYTGSFDPVTNGHLDVLRQACGVADRIVVAIGVHSSKAPVFPAEERAEMLEAVCGPVLQAEGRRARGRRPSTIWPSRPPAGMAPA